MRRRDADRATPDPGAGRGAELPLPARARGAVASAALTLAVVLAVTSNGYGYHRDELYFRMLHPAWGYVDQPPLTPALARLMSDLADTPWALRLPATLAAVLSVLLVAALAREVGGDRRAQSLAAWGFAFASFPLVVAHVLLAATVDLVAWLALALCLVRALLRPDPRWWLGVGVVLGVATTNKLLVGLLAAALAVGLLVAGPRRLPGAHVARWVGAGALVALVLATPTLVYQATHDWPQLAMGRALSADHGGEVRAQLVPFLFLLLGPPLTVVWGAGLWALVRWPQWRRLRFLAVALPVLVVLTLVAGGQVHYPLGLLCVVYAVGCVPASHLTRRWWLALRALVVVNALVSAVIALPLVPLSALGATPVPGINQSAADTVGWPAYVREVAAVHATLPAAEREGAIVITSNYGEAGAVARYGPALGLPTPLSGHNGLWTQSRPPASRVPAVVVGEGAGRVAAGFATCTRVGTLDNGVDVDTEEQDQPIRVCRDPQQDWEDAWGPFRHLD